MFAPMLRQLGYLLLLVIAMNCKSVVFAQPPTKDQAASPIEIATKLDAFLKHYETKNKFMGTVAVSIDGKQVFDRQYGVIVADAKSGPKPNRDSQYWIGSITKMFTSVMIMQLVESGKVTLETKLSKFYPNLKNADKITIAQMLGHRSGLGSVTEDPTYPQWFTEPQTRKKMLERISKQPTKFEPDAKTDYSNTNYILLGYIIEDITDRSYADELQSRIVKPLGLKRTTYAVKSDASKNVAASFLRLNDKWQVEKGTDPSVPHGAGAIISTPADLCLFIEGLFGGKLLSEDSVKRMSAMKDNMGFGIVQFPFNNRRALGHNGTIDGFQSNVAYFQKEKISIALIGNGFDCPMNDIMLGLLTIVFGGDATLPSFEKINVPKDVLMGYEGVYSSPTIPLKITIKLVDGTLTGQATGQGAFPLTPTSDVRFEFTAAGIVISFAKSKSDSGFDQLELRQGGQVLKFAKEK